MAGADELAELRGEIVALETALAAAFGEIAALRAAMTGGGVKAAGEAMDAMATDLERSVLHGIVLAEAAGQAGAVAGLEPWLHLLGSRGLRQIRRGSVAVAPVFAAAN